jgi:hypothetical protein
MVIIIWLLDLQLPVQSVPITTNVSLNPGFLVVEEAGVPEENHRPWAAKQLVNFITCTCESSAPFFVIYKGGCEPTPYW